MKLDLGQIKSVTVGAINVYCENDGIHFAKCTQKQIDAWYAKREDIGKRATMTAGIRLDFHTNSSTLRFSASSGKKYEVYIDGLFKKLFDMDELRERKSAAEITLSEDGAEHRVTLYLPAHNEAGVISYVELDDGASLVPHKFDTKILFLGDSITQGAAAEHDSLSFTNRVSRFFNAESIINGIGSAYFNEEAFDSIDFRPDTVIVAFGTNDFDHYPSIESMKHHANAYLELVAAEYSSCARNLFYISPIWRGDLDKRERAVGTFEECRAALAEIAVYRGFIHVDGYELLPHSPDMFGDRFIIHPNDDGFAHYAKNLIEKIKKYI